MEDDFVLLLQTFIRDGHQRIIDLQQALAAGNCSALREAAHAFKGSSGNIGATNLHAICLTVEIKGQQQDLSDTAALVQDIEREFAQVEDYLTHKFLAG